MENQQNNSQTRQAGSGQMSPGDQAPPGTPGTGEDLCPKCGGKGQLNGRPCENCDGTGKIVKGIGGA
jgi:DnaJ-class molecular chaperone